METQDFDLNIETKVIKDESMNSTSMVNPYH